MKISCVKPYLNAYDFMRYLCAALALKDKKRIPLDSIVERIYDYRIKNEKSSFVFSDIEFRKGLNYVVSNDIMESIGELQTFGIVGKENPKYVNMLIYLSDENAKAILKTCSSDILPIINSIASTF
ncbi:MAG: hypothetical protein IJR88_05035 [Clostridia bacterium]|nr:hypothetical protein [Clostridia bacterium]